MMKSPSRQLKSAASPLLYRVSQLPNGLTVATASLPHMSSVSVGLWVGVGGRYEPAPLSGVSHFIEHMLFKGTRKRSAAQISQSVEGLGGYLNAFTSEEITCFYSKARHDKFDELLEVLADMFLNSRFDRVELDKERNVIKEELAMYLDQPQQHVHELLNETMWPGQPLGRSLTGTPETLDAMRRDDLLNYKNKNYVTESTLLAVAGNIDHNTVVKAISRYAKTFPRASRPTFTPVVVDQSAPRLRLHTKQTEQTQIALGIRSCSRHDKRRFALRILNTILGENMSSRLFQIIREDNGLAYNIYSHASCFEDAGSITISAGLETDRLEKALKLTMRELARLAQKPVPPAELRRARDYVIGTLDLSLENTENQMMWLGEQYLGYGKVEAPNKLKSDLARVTASEVRQVAKDFFQADRIALALVSPLKKADHLAKQLTPRA
jgi:predicted Zn-dependent peptidase